VNAEKKRSGRGLAAAQAASGGRFALHERMMAEARRIIDAAREVKALLRLTGGLAVRHHCTDLTFADRDYGDIDMVGLRRQASHLRTLFARLGFRENPHVATATQGSQRQYFRRSGSFASRTHTTGEPRPALPAPVEHVADHVDVFLDQMKMDHVIVLRERLQIDDYAISASDAFVTKLQIFRLNRKDIHDVVALAKDVPPGRDDRPAVINLAYIAKLCADDWGLYIDVLANIEKCLAALPAFDLPDADYDRVTSTLTGAQAAISGAAKTLRWRFRSTIGRRMAWRREVEETGAASRPYEDIWGVTDGEYPG